MLEKEDNQTYVKDAMETESIQNANKDYLIDDNNNLYIMCIYNAILITQGFLKILYYLRIYKSFSK